MEETQDSNLADEEPASEQEIVTVNDEVQNNEEVEEAQENVHAVFNEKSSEHEDVLPPVDGIEEERTDQEDQNLPIKTEYTEDEKDEMLPEFIQIQPEAPNMDDEYQKVEKKKSDNYLLIEVQVETAQKLELDQNFDSVQKEERRVSQLDGRSSVKEEIAVDTEEGVKTQVKYSITRSGTSQLAEVIYKAASRIIRDPILPVNWYTYQSSLPGASVRGARNVSNRQDVESLRHDFQEYRNLCKNQWQPNPACTVPMRVKGYGQRSRVKVEDVEEWRIWEERDKERRDHELAKELGYETLVGNILYIDIPGGKDINRSWQNFLSEDVMEWGFPYKKGSIQRPRMKLPEPYLAHQVKEKLWKFPRTRTLQTTQEE